MEVLKIISVDSVSLDLKIVELLNMQMAEFGPMDVLKALGCADR